MLQKIQNMIEQENMIEKGDVILVGCSGGADSVCLLLIMKKLSVQYQATIAAVHVEHGIRKEESRQDAAFVEELCIEQGIPFHCYPVDVPEYAKANHLGTEEAARILRYEAFFQCAKEYSDVGKLRIALAHHEEDNAETILFHMARGSGILGLCGMQPVREEQGVAFIRPLLGCTRGEIETYLAQNGQTYRTDSTNADDVYSRNRIRAHVMPQLQQLNPQAVHHINQTAKRLSVIHDFLQMQAKAEYASQVRWEGQRCCVNRNAILQLHPAIQAEVIRMVLCEVAKKSRDIAAEHVQAVLKLLQKQTGRRLSLPYHITVCVEYDDLCFYRGERLPFLISSDGIEGDFFIRIYHRTDKNEEISKKTYTKMFDYDKIKDNFVIRTRLDGDYFVYDREGHHKKLSNYFVDEKIPSGQRDQIPLLAIGHEIIWIVGGRIGENYKVTEDTVRIMEITYEGGADGRKVRE